MKDESFVPYIPPEKVLPELTLKVVVLGVLLAVVMAAANAYLGLYVGMTVSASIPAAVISMAIMRYLKGNILENNMVKTMAAAGEALAAGVIFTIPALLILYQDPDIAGRAGWATLELNSYYYMNIFVPALIGGILGVFFTIPLRRILIVDMDLPYPEGVACTEVLKAGERGGTGMTYVFSALGIGALFKFAGSHLGLRLWKERILAISESGNARAFVGMDLSPALMGVGYIIGPRISLMVFSGGVLGWAILLPIIGMVKGYPAPGYDGIIGVWRAETMYVGVGAIIVGGLYTLVKMRGAIMKGISSTIGLKGRGVRKTAPVRTETDFKTSVIYYLIIVGGITAFYWYLFNSWLITVGSAIFMFGFAFLFTSVAGYIAGVVGSSNNPISGVTVATLLFTAIILLVFGADQNAGMTATVLVAAVVCCSAAIAGDCMQELKTGQLLGSTPRNLQIAEFIGVISAALVLAPIVIYLHLAYTIGSPQLPAPQANVMAAVVKGVFTLHMNLLMLGIGVLIALVFIILERLKIANISIMAVAIGIYLPFTLTTPIFLGGVVSHLVDVFLAKKVRKEGGSTEDIKKVQVESKNRGVLVASGLVAGEAIMGVVIAVLVISKVDLVMIPGPIAWPGLLLFFYIVALCAYMAVREEIADVPGSRIVALLKATFTDPFDRKR